MGCINQVRVVSVAENHLSVSTIILIRLYNVPVKLMYSANQICMGYRPVTKLTQQLASIVTRYNIITTTWHICQVVVIMIIIVLHNYRQQHAPVTCKHSINPHETRVHYDKDNKQTYHGVDNNTATR